MACGYCATLYCPESPTLPCYAVSCATRHGIKALAKHFVLLLVNCVTNRRQRLPNHRQCGYLPDPAHTGYCKSWNQNALLVHDKHVRIHYNVANQTHNGARGRVSMALIEVTGLRKTFEYTKKEEGLQSSFRSLFHREKL